jgi:hypothetical protein
MGQHFSKRKLRIATEQTRRGWRGSDTHGVGGGRTGSSCPLSLPHAGLLTLVAMVRHRHELKDLRTESA